MELRLPLEVFPGRQATCRAQLTLPRGVLLVNNGIVLGKKLLTGGHIQQQIYLVCPACFKNWEISYSNPDL